MLETEIKKLSSQIEQLNNNFAQFFEMSVSSETTPAVTVEDDQLELEQNEAPTVTKETVRDLCMVKSREAKDNRAKVKKILSDLGAKLVDDLSNDDLIKARDLIGAL
jgi:hypothetical protein